MMDEVRSGIFRARCVYLYLKFNAQNSKQDNGLLWAARLGYMANNEKHRNEA